MRVFTKIKSGSMLLLLTLLCLFSVNGWGQTHLELNPEDGSVTWKGDASGYAATIDGYNVSFDKNESTTDARDPKKNLGHIRVYKGASLTITAPGNATITKVVLNCTTSNYAAGATVDGEAMVTDGTTMTWEGSTTSFVAVATAQMRIESVDITLDGASSKKNANLKFSQTSYTGKIDEIIALSATSDNTASAITYSIDAAETNATVDETTGEFLAEKAGTYTVTATQKGNDEYNDATATCTVKVTDGSQTSALDGVKGLVEQIRNDNSKDDIEYTVNFKDAVVSYVDVNKQNAYIEQDGAGVLFFRYNKDVPYTAGQKFNGVATVTANVYYGTPEVVTIAGVEPTDGGVIPVADVTVEELNNNYQAYESRRVKISGLTVVSDFDNRNANVTSADGTEFVLFDKVKQNLTLNAGDVIDVIGYPAQYKGTPQLNVFSQEDITESGVSSKTIKFGSEKHITFFSDEAYVMPEGVKGAVITGSNMDNELTLDYKYTAGTTVPAKTALLLEGEANATYPYTIDAENTDAADENLLHGYDELLQDGSTAVNGDWENYKFYKLAHGTGASANVFGFYWGANDGESFDFTAAGKDKAYLAVPVTAGASAPVFFSIDGDGSTTGINGVNAENDADVKVYSVAGTYLGKSAKNLPAGVYIVNGKKYVVR